MESLVELSYRWYSLMSQLGNSLGAPVQSLLVTQNIPGLSAFLLGLLGGLAPCQVSANAGAIVYVTQSDRSQYRLWPNVGSFILGKAAVYTVLGFLAAFLGWRLPTPMMAFLRKLSGPLLIAMALYLLGWLRWRGTAGARVTEWLSDHMPRAISPAFGLGAAFSLGFCPTMAIIFFGWLVPLLLQSQAGLLLAAIFAAGTAVPVILWAGLLSFGRGSVKPWVSGLRRADRYVKAGAGSILVLLGLNDIVLYWFM